MGLPAFLLNIITWIWLSVFLMIMLIAYTIVLVLMKLFTHGFEELKAKMSGKPICMFFEDSRYATWKPIKPESGMIQDKEYGSFIVNEQGTYVDRRTKNIYIPFDAGFGAGGSIKSFKMSDDLWKVFRDEGKLNQIRISLMKGELDGTELEGLRESINFSHLRSLSNTILPHNITGKIEKALAQRMQGLSQVNIVQLSLMFAIILGAIVMGGVLLKMYA